MHKIHQTRGQHSGFFKNILIKKQQRSGPRCLLIATWALIFWMFSSFCITPSVYAVGIQPTDVLQNGYMLFSCFAENLNEPALAIMDLSPAGGLYDDPANRVGLTDVSSSFPKTTMWNLSEFDGGQIMGTAFDRRDGTIYVSTSRMYAGTVFSTPEATEVWRIAPSGGAPVLFASLPGNQGTGWLDLDEDHEQLYVSNMDDGQIYIIDTTAGPGQTMANTGGFTTFAPHASHALNDDTNSDPIMDGMPPLGERIWGVGYNQAESRLYYTVWAQDLIGTDPNTIRSVAINPDGTINTATDQLEVTMIDHNLLRTTGETITAQMPPSDIEFSQDGKTMLLAEQSFDSTVRAGISPMAEAHLSNLIEVQGGSGNWVIEPTTKHKIGEIAGVIETSSRGGTAFAHHSINNTGLLEGEEEYIVTTGDILAMGGGQFIYGIQYHPMTGGSAANSLKIDLNGDISEGSSKFVYGDVDIRMEIKDYGDLPDHYVTTGVITGASHILDGLTYLGAGVDPDGDGQPSANAQGDNANQDGTHVTDLPNDEDGITFLDPLMPGKTARIQVVAGSDGFLNAFIDFDNDGILDNITIDGSSATGSAGTLADLQLGAGTHIITIDLPATIGEQIYSRFRFTAEAGDLAAATPTGTAATGEVEDYVLMSIGNRVWLDNGAGGNGNNGQFDANEQAVSGVALALYDMTNTLIATTTTDIDGYYRFTGLISSTYTVQVAPINFQSGGQLAGYLSTTGIENGDTIDSTAASSDNGIDDTNPAANGINSNVIALALGTEPTGEEISGGTDSTTHSNMTVDFGFIQHDWGDLPHGNAVDSPSYNTLDHGAPALAGPSHIIVPGLYLGTVVDAEMDGQPDGTAEGDDTEGDTSNDEDGITLPSFTPGAAAAVDVTLVNTTGVNATLYGFIDFDGDGLFTTPGEVRSIPANSSGTYQLNFNVPANADATQLLGARFRLSTDGTLGPNGPAPDGEVEDYLIATQGEEYGDLPDIYGTINAGTVVTPAVHTITETLRLGSILDSDSDGTASLGADGDDINNGADDEDGITFLTPIMAGEPVEIQVSATISAITPGSPNNNATVGAWIDLNGDGDFADAQEFHPLTLNGSGIVTNTITFIAPATISDTIYSRFRIAYDSTEVDDVGDHVGSAATGEVEDYVLMSLGNQIWLDDGTGNSTANDGIFDLGETGMSSIIVELYRDGWGRPAAGRIDLHHRYHSGQCGPR